MKLNVLISSGDYRGDHETDILVPVDVDPSETIESLVTRTLHATRIKSGDHLQIRMIEERGLDNEY